jgi:hypothetical protein
MGEVSCLTKKKSKEGMCGADVSTDDTHNLNTHPSSWEGRWKSFV